MPLIRLALTASLVLGGARMAAAQIFRLGPLGDVHVRVPFVSVDVGPFGGTRVRAPFTALDVPPRGLPYPLPYYDGPLPDVPYHAPPLASPVPPPRYYIPSYDEVTEFGTIAPSPPYSAAAASTDRLSDALADAARQLRTDLAGHPEEDIWIGYLQPAAVASLATRLDEGYGLGSIAVEEVRGIASNFDGVAANPELDWLSSMPGFVQSRAVLRRLAIALGDPPQEDPLAYPLTQELTPENGEFYEPLPAPIPDPLPGATPADSTVPSSTAPASPPNGAPQRTRPVYRAEV